MLNAQIPKLAIRFIKITNLTMPQNGIGPACPKLTAYIQAREPVTAMRKQEARIFFAADNC
jgi:hypothetical protein